MLLTFFVISVVAFIFLLIRFLVVLFNFLEDPRLPHPEKASETEPPPLVSILIPARNEAHNLPQTLEAILKEQAYTHFEVVILDDNSSDRTAAVIADFARRDKRIRGVRGTSLPAGWLGKNWACDQLAALAEGDYLLFVDADVQLRGKAIEAALQTLKTEKLALLSVFPDQKMHTFGERLVVPVMHYMLLTLLPLSFIRRFAFPSMAAANGQFMFFDARVYRREQWHERVRLRITEDIDIVREIKRKGLRAGTYLGNHMIYCRMYNNFQTAFQGFSKNLLAGFGGSILGLLLFLFLLTLAFFPAFWLYPLPTLIALLVLGGLMNLLLALRAHQPVWIWVLLHPLRLLVLCGIGLNSIYLKLSGKNTWKGRKI